MTTLLYFAYGSNMFTPRLRYRVPSCTALGVATLAGHQLRFHKRSNDGSGKCNAFSSGNAVDLVHGVAFEIPLNEKFRLDSAEGLGNGYHDRTVDLLFGDGRSIQAQCYIADDKYIDDHLTPYSWYKDFVLEGALEHRLPQDYIDSFIGSVRDRPDPDKGREQKRRAEVVLTTARDEP